MQHVAIDLGGRESQVCIRGQDGQILLERKLATRSLKGFLEQQSPSRVVLETCAEAFAVADLAVECQHEVRVVPATLVRSLGVGARGIKTDRRDAQVLSEVSCRIDLPSCACGWARTQLLKFRSGEPTTLPSRVRKAAEQHPDGLPDYIERVLVVVESLNVQIALADKELEQLAKQDPVCKRLMTVSGIGPSRAYASWRRWTTCRAF
jgi:transposase